METTHVFPVKALFPFIIFRAFCVKAKYSITFELPFTVLSFPGRKNQRLEKGFAENGLRLYLLTRNELRFHFEEWEDHFRCRHYKKNHADQRIQPEERVLHPIETPASRQPMFEDEAARNNHNADQVGDLESAEEPKHSEDHHHQHMR